MCVFRHCCRTRLCNLHRLSSHSNISFQHAQNSANGELWCKRPRCPTRSLAMDVIVGGVTRDQCDKALARSRIEPEVVISRDDLDVDFCIRDIAPSFELLRMDQRISVTNHCQYRHSNGWSGHW